MFSGIAGGAALRGRPIREEGAFRKAVFVSRIMAAPKGDRVDAVS